MAAMLISAQAVDYDGAVLSGAKLNVYDAGTTTPRAIYASKDLASGASSANPAVATATGGIAVWVDDSAGDIKVTLTNSAGTTTYYSQDNIDPTNGNVVVFPLGGQDQTLASTDSVAFAGVTLSGNLDMQGNRIVLDADNDSYIAVNSDDSVSIFIGGTEVIKLDASASDVFTLDGVSFSPTGAVVGQALGYPNSPTTVEPYTPAGAGDVLAAADNDFTGDNDFAGALNRSGQAIYDLAAYASLAAAITAIGATPARLYINSTETLTADATIPATMVLAFGPSGQIATGTYTLTVNGGVDARRQQIFDPSGGGSVSGAPILDHVYPEWFGADGAGNDLTEVQNALDFAALAGAWVEVSKSHALAGDLTVNSGQLVRGMTDRAGFTSLRLSLTGTTGSQISLTSAAAAGDTSLSLDTSTLSDGDWVKVASVINSGSSDAGENRLGNDATEESYLSEFVQLLDATSSGSSATLRRELTFPYSNTPGTDTAASLTGQTLTDRKSVVWEVTWCEGVRFVDMELSTINTGSGSDAIILGEFCRDVIFERCRIDTGDVTGWAASFVYSLDCFLVDCDIQGKVTSIDSGSTDNPVLFQSSTNCMVKGGSLRGGNQGVDVITFGPDVGASGHRGGPSIGCGAEGVFFENQQTDGAISHPGCYGSQFNNNRIFASSIGVRLRSPFDQAHGNVIVGGTSVNGRGVFASGGYVRGASVKGNTIISLQRGISVEPGDPANWTLPVNVAVQDNICWYSVRAVQLVSPTTNTDQYYGATVSGNQSYGCTGSHILIEEYFNGARVTDNFADGVDSGFAGIEYEGNQSHLFIDRNYTRDVHASGYSVKGNGGAAITGTSVFAGGEADAYWYIGTHYGEGSATGVSHGATAKLARTDLSSEAYTFGDLAATDVVAGTATIGDGSGSVPLAVTRSGSTGAVGIKFENSVGPVTLVADGTGSGAGAMYALFGSTVTFGTPSIPWKSFYSNDGYYVGSTKVVGSRVIDANLADTAALTAQTLTDNSGGSAADTIAAIGATYSQSEVANAVASLADEINKLRADNVAQKAALDAALTLIRTHGLGATS